ncbi:TPA: tyrosine phenol-lyase, partial [Candidatus Edwardsbacteria bacterium]|nr:tyrosine phenol-lyase [Candidatus Edwardsbacteria bacterium]
MNLLPFAEPYKTKMVEPIRRTTRAEREELIKKAGYNLFNLKSDDVFIDLLTDSGTGAMSSAQWAEIMLGDESYAGASSYYKLKKTIEELLGMPYFLPTHQGRAAENVLFSALMGMEAPDLVVPGNSHFDTTKGHIEFRKAQALDCTIDQAFDTSSQHPFKGNLDLNKLEAVFKKHPKENIPLCLITVTCNSSGGQPVSLENIKAVSAMCKKYGIRLFFDAARFAENAYFIKLREPGYADKSIKQIVREMFDLVDGCTMSAKKDALVNMGGFLAMNDGTLATKARNLLIVTEGFTTYGGLAGRDLEAIAQGLDEILDEHNLTYRIRSVEYLGEKLTKAGVPIVQPPGGHAIYLDAKRFADHIPPHQYPGQSIVCELFRAGGIRSVEIGSVMFGKYDKKTGTLISPSMELVRLAMPRRVYTQSHIDFVIEVIMDVHDR